MALGQYLRTLHPAHRQQAEKGDTGPMHRDTLPPTRPHGLLLPKQIYSLVAKHQTYGHIGNTLNQATTLHNRSTTGLCH